jgi:peptidoglycan hydrolase-like amidase
MTTLTMRYLRKLLTTSFQLSLAKPVCALSILAALTMSTDDRRSSATPEAASSRASSKSHARTQRGLTCFLRRVPPTSSFSAIYSSKQLTTRSKATYPPH